MNFEPLTIALHGRHLIEASAGTGKTYSIANLFLRLLLEAHPSQTDNLPLTIDQILVVTFTNAATDELRGRIRRKIEEALDYFRGGESHDPFIIEYRNTQLVEEAMRGVACKRLYHALQLVDEAAVFTIHGFASRAIQTFLFETGALADVEVVIGQSDRQAQQFDDLIRQLVMSKRSKLGFYLSNQRINARKYVAELNNLLGRAGVEIRKSLYIADEVIQQYETERDRLLAQRKTLIDQWQYIDTDAGKAYNKIRDVLVRDIGNGITSANITYALKFCNNDLKFLKGIKKPVVAFDKIHGCNQAAALAGCTKQLYDIVDNIYSFNKNEDALSAAVQTSQSALLELLLDKPLKMDPASLQPDEVIHLINSKLDDPAAADILRRVITSQYPVCMVDEFQDTDPDQFRMFDRIYAADNNNLGLYAIGDPKQSIYAFRGADVFAYLDVKAGTETENIHTLDTNFRSTQGVMDGVNALFREPAAGGDCSVDKDQDNNPVFVFPGIKYENIFSCENPRTGKPVAKGLYCVGDRVPASLVLIGHESDKSQSFNSLLPVYAKDCAERIVSLLQGEQRATVNNNDGKTEAIGPGDIAVLVREYREAVAVKQALAERGLIAVYIAQKDSVLQRCIFAKDILFILRAMDDPYSKRQLKAAFATPLLRHFHAGTEKLQALEQDDVFEKTIQQFAEYCKRWEEKGVMPALYELLEEQGLVEVFAGHPDCDRLMTDFRHIGELLQQQYLLAGSRERLIDWYASQLSDDSAMEEDAKSLRLESDDNLVKIVTLHGCKGLEYPVVFIPFFFGFKDVDLAKTPPFYHQPIDYGGIKKWQAMLDFQSDRELVKKKMCEERMAEDMRLLYVGITRAIYQCYIGISRSYHGSVSNPLFPKTCWSYLLGLGADDSSPSWDTIQQVLRERMQNSPCEFTTTLKSRTLFSGIEYKEKTLMAALPDSRFPQSSWQITSYSALAHQKDMRLLSGVKSDDEVVAAQQENSAQLWRNDIRYRLRGSNITGDCLHKVFQELAGGKLLPAVLENELRIHGLLQPEWPVPEKSTIEEQIVLRGNLIAAWLQTVLAVPLQQTVPSLQTLFEEGKGLPELDFDFSLGSGDRELEISDINRVLQQDGLVSAGIARKDNRQKIHGYMTGSIDLLFIHNKKIYVLDYKSNTLGKAPHFYDQASMAQAMKDNRYDLQYLIYSVAAHRYMKQRLGDRYDFDTGEYSFGGVFYLFLRGMGLPEYPGNGIWFHRPEKISIAAMDAVFSGMEIAHA